MAERLLPYRGKEPEPEPEWETALFLANTEAEINAALALRDKTSK